MKFYKYINESRTKIVDEEFAYSFIEKYCQDAFNGTPLYRGIYEYVRFCYYIDPSKSTERISPYATFNYYNLLFSNLPSWKKFPPRNKSVICTTDYDDARYRQDGSKPYLVIPKDGSKIGVCPVKDICIVLKIL